MYYCNVEIEIDLFDYKYKILKSLGTDDIENELKSRKEKDIYVKDTSILYHEIDVDMSDYDDEILDKLTTTELQDELTSRGYKVFDKYEYTIRNLATRKDICKFLGIREWSTKEQILSELNNIL